MCAVGEAFWISGKEEGIEEGHREERTRIIICLLNDGHAPDEIATMLRVDPAEVREVCGQNV